MAFEGIRSTKDSRVALSCVGRRSARWAAVVALCATIAGVVPSATAQPELPKPALLPKADEVPAPGVPDRVPIAPSKNIPGFGPEQIRLPRLASDPTLGQTPVPTAETKAKIQRYIENVLDPETTLDVIIGQPRVINLKTVPRRVQIGDEAIALYNLPSPTELMLQGSSVGTTTLYLWFPDPKDAKKLETLSYLVRVIPDPEAKLRLERSFKALAEEINRLFPNSMIDIHLVGDKVVVVGRTHDVEEGTQIMRIVRSNLPGGTAARIPVEPAKLIPDRTPAWPEGAKPPATEDFQNAGGPNVINMLQVTGEQQVKLHVVVAEVNRTAARSIGLNFSVTNNRGVTVFSNNTGGLLGNNGNNGGVGAGVGNFGGLMNSTANILAVLDGGQIPLAIEALRNVNFARSYAEPILTTLNGQTATFQAGGQFPVPVVTGQTANGLEGVSFIPFGVQLSFTPYVTDKDRIRLNINANVSDRDVSTGAVIAGASVSGLTTRNFTTTVELRDGETLAVAGLIQSNLGSDSATIPFFGDIPFLGNLTGRRHTSAGEQELVILIQPELVHPLPPGAKVALPGSDLFEANDVEFYLMGRIESHIPVDYRSPIRDDLSRILQYYRLERKYLAGPTGYSEDTGE